jgi:serine/threonine protein phosphatase 1
MIKARSKRQAQHAFRKKQRTRRMMKKFVIGDIHGTHKALVQCLARSGFDKKKDMLIVIGDVVDRYHDVKACVAELLTVKNLVLVLGNHDAWFIEWLENPAGRMIEWDWNGGLETKKSYGNKPVPKRHRAFFEKGRPFHVEGNKLFVHGGCSEKLPAGEQDPQLLMWDRNLWKKAAWWQASDPAHKLSSYDEIIIGHTPTDTRGPAKCCNVWNIDQGAGWGGYLTVMDIDTHEWWTSDCVQELYPG